MSLPYVVVLAGGEGARLGGMRKADIVFQGERLLNRVLSRLGPTAKPLLIAAGPHDLSVPPDARSVADLPVGPRGPLAGILSAAAFLRRTGVEKGQLISVTVDTPFLPNDYLARLLDRLGDAAAAYASWHGTPYPPNAIWRLEALDVDPAQTTSAKALLSNLNAAAIDWSDTHAVDPFRNINTPADLLMLSEDLTL